MMQGTNGSREAQMSPRGLLAESEATRDPMFLFQQRRLISFVNAPGFEWPEGWEVDDDGHLTRDGEDVSWSDAVEADLGAFWWETTSVFATREEAQAYGERRPYAWGKEGEGWRVYCVPAEGELAELMVTHWRGQREV